MTTTSELDEEALEFCRMLFEHGRLAEANDTLNWGIGETFKPYQDLLTLKKKWQNEARLDEAEACKYLMVNLGPLAKSSLEKRIVYLEAELTAQGKGK